VRRGFTGENENQPDKTGDERNEASYTLNANGNRRRKKVPIGKRGLGFGTDTKEKVPPEIVTNLEEGAGLRSYNRLEGLWRTQENEANRGEFRTKRLCQKRRTGARGAGDSWDALAAQKTRDPVSS